MKQIILCLALLFCTAGITAQEMIPSTPAPAMYYGDFPDHSMTPWRHEGEDGYYTPGKPLINNPAIYMPPPAYVISGPHIPPLLPVCSLSVEKKNDLPGMEQQIRDYLGDDEEAVSQFEQFMPSTCEEKYVYLSDLLKQIGARG